MKKQDENDNFYLNDGLKEKAFSMNVFIYDGSDMTGKTSTVNKVYEYLKEKQKEKDFSILYIKTPIQKLRDEFLDEDTNILFDNIKNNNISIQNPHLKNGLLIKHAFRNIIGQLYAHYYVIDTFSKNINILKNENNISLFFNKIKDILAKNDENDIKNDKNLYIIFDRSILSYYAYQIRSLLKIFKKLFDIDIADKRNNEEFNLILDEFRTKAKKENMKFFIKRTNDLTLQDLFNDKKIDNIIERVYKDFTNVIVPDVIYKKYITNFIFNKNDKLREKSMRERNNIEPIETIEKYTEYVDETFKNNNLKVLRNCKTIYIKDITDTKEYNSIFEYIDKKIK